MEENKVVVNEKWKNILLKIAMIFQCMKIVIVIMAIIFQKPLLSFVTGQTTYNNHYLVPVQAIITVILSTIIFCICYKLIKNNKDEVHIRKEVCCIILALPVYNILNYVLTTIGRNIQLAKLNAAYQNTIQYNYDINYNYILENSISMAQFIFKYSMWLLVIVAAILIGKKLKSK